MANRNPKCNLLSARDLLVYLRTFANRTLSEDWNNVCSADNDNSE